MERKKFAQRREICERQNDSSVHRHLSPARSKIVKRILTLLSFCLPWEIRRSFLEKHFAYTIHPTCRIVFIFFFPTRLIMEEGSRIGHLTMCKNIDLLHLKAHTSIGNGNWITGFPLGPSRHFAEEKHRKH